MSHQQISRRNLLKLMGAGAAGAAVAVIPTLVVFVLAQRFIMSGITVGAVRG